MWLTFAVIMLIISISAWYLYQSASWPDVQGKVLSSKIGKVYNQPGSIGNENKRTFDYKVLLDYEYSVNGEKQIGHNLYVLLPNIFSNKHEAENVISEFSAGKLVQVYYDPGSPSQSCLITTKTIPLKGINNVYCANGRCGSIRGWWHFYDE
ncbi:MAG: DUF3592 domain-containing protein [Gammaproteobacteria bacterium]|nr:DUF3592 domain-containing protein [Gammaproteobacteria bacterium]